MSKTLKNITGIQTEDSFLSVGDTFLESIDISSNKFKEDINVPLSAQKDSIYWEKKLFRSRATPNFPKIANRALNMSADLPQDSLRSSTKA